MAYRFPRCRVIPQDGHRVAFEIEGVQSLRWHFGPAYPRPFFYPLRGPSGAALTRLGHPGAPDHEHHRSIWFGHAKVLGIDFWSDQATARIRQKRWLCYQDGDDEARMAVELGWYDGHDPQELLAQELVVVVRPGPTGETFVEMQSIFRPSAETLEFGQTNFGFLAVRVSKDLSVHFGGGRLTNSEGASGEPAIFGRPARWVDYSGPAPVAHEAGNQDSQEGITYFDHPSNPGHPSAWHVREDGWMGASACMHSALITTRAQPLKLRYLLHAHRDAVHQQRADVVAGHFAASPPYAVAAAKGKHEHYTIEHVPGG